MYVGGQFTNGCEDHRRYSKDRVEELSDKWPEWTNADRRAMAELVAVAFRLGEVPPIPDHFVPLDGGDDPDREGTWQYYLAMLIRDELGDRYCLECGRYFPATNYVHKPGVVVHDSYIPRVGGGYFIVRVCPHCGGDLSETVEVGGVSV